MFATRIVLTAADCAQRKIVSDYDVHQLVYRIFMKDREAEERDFLYRADIKQGGLSLIVHSQRVPAVFEGLDMEVKEIKESFFEYPRYAFSLRFAPVKQLLEGKEVVLLKEEDTLSWLKNREDGLGVRFIDGTLYRSGKGCISNKRVSLIYSDVSGVLEVVNKERFVVSFQKGIGRHKAFGFGMLQLIPIR